MNNKSNKILQYLLIATIGGFFIYFVFKGTNWQEMFAKISNANFYWLSLAMLVGIFSHWLRAFRGVMMYDAMGYSISTKNSFYAVLIGYMMSYIIPRAGEVSRCASLNKTDSMPIEKSLGTVVTERLVDMLILLLIIAFLFVIQFDLLVNFISHSLDSKTESTTNSILIKSLLALFVIISIVLFFVFRKKIVQHAFYQKLKTGFTAGLLSVKQVKNPILFIVLSFSIWIGYLLMMYICFFAMQSTSNLGIFECLTIFAIGTIGVVLPAPAAGAGSYHFFVIQSLLLFGVRAEDGKAFATMVHGVQMILLLIIGSICSYIVLKTKNKNAIN